MKKIFIIMLSALLVLSGCSSDKSAKTQETTGQKTEESAANETTTVAPTTEAPREPQKEIKQLTIAEFDEMMAGLPISIVKTEYKVQDEQYKSLYPDMLSTLIQNNTESDIKDAVIGLVAWDSNNLPVKIVGQFDFTGGEYFVKVNYSDINMASKSTYGETSGYSLQENCKVASFKPVILSFTTFDGDTWENPYVDSFRKAFEGKKYSDDIVIELEMKDSEFKKAESSGDSFVENASTGELDAALASQPVFVSSTKYVVQNEQYKALYPDMLQAILQNNSEEDIRDAVIAFVAWDSNGLPVKIKGSMSFTEPSYVALVSFDNINMVPGGSYGDTSGYSVDENCGIASFKAIVVSYTNFEDKKWENPNYKEFCDLYEGKRLTQ